MAFTADYHIKTSLGTSATVPDAYFRIDGTTVTGGKDAGYTATIRAYVDEATRMADLGDYIPGSDFSVSVPFVVSEDPYPALYAAAKLNYPDAEDV